MVLDDDVVIAQRLSGGPLTPPFVHPPFVGGVIVGAQHAMAAQPGLHEPAVFLAGHAVVEQELVDPRVHPVAIDQVQRQEAQRVERLGLADRCRAVGMDIGGAFALDEDRIGAHLEDRDHRHHAGGAQMLDRCHEAALVTARLVQQPQPGRGEGGDEDRADRRIKLHPGITLGESPGIAGEETGHVRVLEVAQPVGHAQPAQIGDGHDVVLVHPLQHGIGMAPIVLPLGQPRAVDRRAEAQVTGAQVLHQIDVAGPAVIVPGQLHLVMPTATDARRGRIDPGGEHEERIERRVRRHGGLPAGAAGAGPAKGQPVRPLQVPRLTPRRCTPSSRCGPARRAAGRPRPARGPGHWRPCRAAPGP